MSKANEALDRMAENARELGLDYEPDGMHHNKPQKRPQNCGTGYCSCIECVMEPAQQEPVAWIVEFENGEQELHFEAQSVGEKNTPLYTSQAQQKPYRLLQDNGSKYFGESWDKAEQPAHAPVEWMEMVVANLVREGVNKHKARELAQHFYASPPAQRTWVGLTDEERTEIRREHFARTLPLMDAVEAKLKEKNT